MRQHPGLVGLAATLFGGLLLLGPAQGAEDPYPKRVWGAFNGGDMNSSVLVFRDMNRNGIYDLGDRPMPDVAVQLAKPDGRTHLERTNIGGFANFRMSVILRDREIVDPGHYSFEVVPPPGWSITTGNRLQESDYAVTPGAPGDMIARRTTHPVGLAAGLTISGTAAPGAVVRLSGPGGVVRDLKADKDGYFTSPASAGEWQVAVSANEKAEHRKIIVGTAPVIVSSLGRIGKEPLPALHVLGFDDLMTSTGVFEVPSGYGGLTWYNLVAMHQRFTGGPGYINAAMSGEYIAYNSSGHPATVSSGTQFDFVGAYMGAGWTAAEGETLHIKAWRGEDVAYEDQLTLSAYGPLFFAADYRQVTRIEIRTEHYWQAVIDDFTYRTKQ